VAHSPHQDIFLEQEFWAVDHTVKLESVTAAEVWEGFAGIETDAVHFVAEREILRFAKSSSGNATMIKRKRMLVNFRGVDCLLVQYFNKAALAVAFR